MLGLVTHLAIALGLVIGTSTDFKTREVPDWLNFSLIGIGLGLGLLGSFLLWNAKPLINSVAGLLVGVIIGYVMFYAGQWGGGDAKLIMGLGALFGIDVFSRVGLAALPPLLLFIINTVLVGALYGLLWALIIALKHQKVLKNELKRRLQEPRIKRYRITIIAATTLLIMLAFIAHSAFLTFSFAILAFILFFLFYLWLITKAVERTCMVKEAPLSKVTEGDWVYKDVWLKTPYRSFKEHELHESARHLSERQEHDPLLRLYRGVGWKRMAASREHTINKAAAKAVQERLHRCVEQYLKEERVNKKELTSALEGTKARFLSFTKKHPRILLFLKERYRYAPDQRYLCGPADLGISKEQILDLKRMNVTSLTIKEGIPFVPSFLLAYLVTMLLGNWLLYLI